MTPEDRAEVEQIKEDLLVAERPETIMFTAAKWREDCEVLLHALAAIEERRSHYEDVAAERLRHLDAQTALVARLREERDAAVKILSRLGLVPHAGTWITREEQAAISKDGP